MKKSYIGIIFPANNKKVAGNFEKDIKDKYPEIEVVPVFKAKSFFDAWKDGLTKTSAETLIFTHQDVQIQKIPNFEKYFESGAGMLGAAGSKEVTAEVPWWFDGDRLYRGKLSGEVTHWTPEEPFDVVNYGAYGKVVVLDGVFLVTKRHILSEVGIPDIEWCKWDFYDHVLSIEYIKKGFKLRTIPVQMVHISPGGGSKDFEKVKERFVKEYFNENKIWKV